MARHYSASQWQTWFTEFEQSELTVGDFCRSVGTSVNTFYKWRKRLAAEDATAADVAFVPVVISGSGEVRFEFPGGVTAVISNDHQSLSAMVQVLLQQGVQQ